MAITVNYGNFSGTGVNGLADYLNWFESSYFDPVHHGSSAFSTASSSTVKVGSSTIAAHINDYQYAGETTGATPVAAFIAHAGTVNNVFDGTGSSTLDKLGYTLFASPAHTLFGNIANLEFGSHYNTSGGLNTMVQTHLNITGISTTANNYGLSDSNPSDGYAYDSITNHTTGNNLTFNIIYGLMGGLGGAASTDALENVFNTYGTTVIGTSANETFNGYAAADIFQVGGGLDLVKDFDTTEDLIDFSGNSVFIDAQDIVDNYLSVNSLTGIATIDDLAGNIVTIEVVGTLSASNFIV